MCKIAQLKKGLSSLKQLLTRYESIVPSTQKDRFKKDISLIFMDLEQIDDEIKLEKMSKLAKTKLKSIERIYGSIKEETKTENNNIGFLSEEYEEFLKKNFNVDPTKPYKSKFQELKNSPGFNPELVKQYQEEYKSEKEKIHQAYYQVTKEKQEERLKKKQNLVDNIMASGSSMDLSNARDEDGFLSREKLKDALRDIMKQNNVENPDEKADEIDIDTLIKNLEDKYEGKEVVNENAKMIEELQKTKKVDVEKTKSLFSVFDNQKRITEEELDVFLDKVKPIFNDEKLSEKEKKELFLKELDKAEEEWTRNNLDGMITYGPYGDIQVKIFKDADEFEEDDKNKKKESVETKSDTGSKTFVWRDGKLVEGKAKERKTVTYSNWHTGHLNPDDLRRHRELLDRQHFGGPLWEGIKYQGNITGKQYVNLHGPTAEDLEALEKNQIKLPKEQGKKEIVEVVR